MIKTENSYTTITCDKCGKESTTKESDYSAVFWKEKWTLNKGTKYEHLCYNCLPIQKQKSLNSFIEKFNESYGK